MKPAGMPRRRPWGAPHTLALAGVAAAMFSAALLGSWSAGGRPFCGPGCIDRRLADLTAADGSLSATKIPLARALVRRQLGYSPFDAAGWLRLAALETTPAGRLTAEGQRALERSYRFTPVDIRVARWRIRFAFEHWTELNPGVRNAAQAELRSLSAASANLNVLKGLDAEVASPAGRLALALLLDQLSR